jgi:hypothetical protein
MRTESIKKKNTTLHKQQNPTTITGESDINLTTKNNEQQPASKTKTIIE